MKPPMIEASIPCPACGETLTAIGYPRYDETGIAGEFTLQLEVTGGNLYEHVQEKHGDRGI